MIVGSIATMRSLFAVLLGIWCFGSSSAVYNLLGENIKYPTIQWRSVEMVNFFARNSYVWAKCKENGLTLTELAETFFKFRPCKTNYSIAIQPGKLEELNITSQCSYTGQFYSCMKDAAQQVSNLCKFNTAMQAYVKNALHVNNVMMTLACEENGKRIRDFGRMGGRECSSALSDNLEKCKDRHWSHDLLFDDEGCKKTWRFVDCVDKRFMSCTDYESKRNCNAEMAEIPVSMMAEALIGTPCKHYCHGNKYCKRFNRIMKYSYMNSSAVVSKGSYAIGLGLATSLLLF